MRTRAGTTAIVISTILLGCAHAEAMSGHRASAGNMGSALRKYSQLMGTIDDQVADRSGAAEQRDTSFDSKGFYADALAEGVAEVALSEHAARHAPSQDVRVLAGMLARHHIETNMRLSEASGMRWPALRDTDRKMLGDLAKVRGAEYDIAYLRLMDERHLASIAVFESAQSRASDESSRKTAETILPMLRTHVAMIESLLGMRLRKR